MHRRGQLCALHVAKKEGHKLTTEENDDSIGDAYTFIALERTSKLVLAWHLGKRDTDNTDAFVNKVRSATKDGERFQLCTDGFTPYLAAIATALYDRADYTKVVKMYSKLEEGRERYSPGEFVSVEKTPMMGEPGLKSATTSHVERQNGSLRQWCKRLTRLTYAFSKKWDNLRAAIAPLRVL